MSELSVPAWRPRAVMVLVAGASAIVLIVGMRNFAGIIGPLFLALVLTVAVQPLREVITRGRVPRWVGTLVALLCIFAVLIFLGVAIVIAGAQLVNLLQDYAGQSTQLQSTVAEQLQRFGVDRDKAKQILGSFDLGKVSTFALSLLSGVAGLASNLVLILGLLLFMGIDAAGYSGVMKNMPSERQAFSTALGRFAVSTRRYLLVSTVFGAIVALLDVAVLYILGIPAPWLWGLLAFITNYIPNIGFLIGLVPPALLALLDGGWKSALLVIVLYAVINAVIQSGLQPKIVGDSVGLSATLSFVSLIFWAFVLGAWGALLAIPLTLFVKAMLVDMDHQSHWVVPLLSGHHDAGPAEPVAASASGPSGSARPADSGSDEPPGPAGSADPDAVAPA
ncbi:MAG TPA: AI-2E family transporter [Microlunatus sp.]|nr:AI-2E family transporter [Microlunatus sp.]